MVKPGARYNESYTLSELVGHDILVIRTNDAYTPEEVMAVETQLRQGNPKWEGSVFIMRIDQTIEKMPEATARQLYDILHGFFAPRGTA